MTIRVIKIGGSLLLRPHLLPDLLAWRRQVERQGDTTIAMVGGGQMIEAVRVWDHLRPGQPAAVHWRCVEMLRHSHDFLREAMKADSSWDRWRPIDSASQWQDYWSSFDEPLPDKREDSQGVPAEFVLLTVPAFYTPTSSRASAIPLPEDWRTTTDAIAIWLTHQLSHDRGTNVQCVLLKSCEISPQWNLPRLIAEGVIDPACSLFEASSIDLRVQRLADSSAGGARVSTLDLVDHSHPGHTED